MKRKQIKKLLNLACRVFILPLLIIYNILSFFLSKDSIFSSFSQLLSLIPGKIGVYLRASFLNWSSESTSIDISIGFLTVFSHIDTTISEGVYIGPQSNVGMCKIGRDTLIGSGVHILSGNKQHSASDIRKPIKQQGGSFIKIKIGSDCWIGNGSIVMASVADHTIIAAGAIVTKDIIDELGVYAGNPAERISERTIVRNQNSENQ